MWGQNLKKIPQADTTKLRWNLWVDTERASTIEKLARMKPWKAPMETLQTFLNLIFFLIIRTFAYLWSVKGRKPKAWAVNRLNLFSVIGFSSMMGSCAHICAQRHHINALIVNFDPLYSVPSAFRIRCFWVNPQRGWGWNYSGPFKWVVISW